SGEARQPRSHARPGHFRRAWRLPDQFREDQDDPDARRLQSLPEPGSDRLRGHRRADRRRHRPGFPEADPVPGPETVASRGALGFLATGPSSDTPPSGGPLVGAAVFLAYTRPREAVPPHWPAGDPVLPPSPSTSRPPPPCRR